MSLQEKLNQKREVKTEIDKKQEQYNLVSKLAKIEEQKTVLSQKRLHLADAIAAFSMAYSEVAKFNNTFKNKSEKLDQLMGEYGDVLKNIDINTKSELITNPELSKELEVEEYKISSRNRKNAVAKVTKLKASRPDLNFRGGKREGEEKSPRELAMEAMQAEVEELDLELRSLTEKEQKLIGEKDTGPEEFLGKLCAEELAKIKNISNVNYDFHINNKPGFNLTYNVLDLGEKYGSEITKKLLQERLAKEYSVDKSDKDIREAIDISWAAGSIRTELEKKELAPVKDYMEKKTATEGFLFRIKPYNPKEGQIFTDGLDPDFLLKIDLDKYKNSIVYPDHEKENDGSRRVSEISGVFENIAKIKIQESSDVLNKTILFGSGKKKQLAHEKSNFYDIVKNKFSGNYVPNLDDNFWKILQVNRNAKIISEEEFQSLNRMYELKKKALDDLKKVREEKNYVNKKFTEFIPKEILHNADWLTAGTVISLKDFKVAVEKYLEDLNNNAEKTDIASETERVKDLFRDYSKVVKAAQRIRPNRDMLETIKRDAGRLIGYDKEISL